MKNLFIIGIVLLVLSFANTGVAHYGIYGPYGYGYYDYGFSNLYPHTLAPGGTWYGPHYITPRPQPPYKPDGLIIRQIRPFRPQLRFIYVPLQKHNTPDPNAKPHKNNKKNNAKKQKR